MNDDSSSQSSAAPEIAPGAVSAPAAIENYRAAATRMRSVLLGVLILKALYVLLGGTIGCLLEGVYEAWWPIPLLPFWLLVLWVSFPFHMSGLFLPLFKMVPHGWDFGKGASATKENPGALAPLPDPVDKHATETSETYLRRSARQLYIGVALLEIPSLLAFLAMLTGAPSLPMIILIFVGAIIAFALLVRVRHIVQIGQSMIEFESS